MGKIFSLRVETSYLLATQGNDIQYKYIPNSLKTYKNLRCTIDCTEVFINRPRDLEIQALTWSDYKKHNTVKFLVGIAPNGMITFLSKAWGGRSTHHQNRQGIYLKRRHHDERCFPENSPT